MYRLLAARASTMLLCSGLVFSMLSLLGYLQGVGNPEPLVSLAYPHECLLREWPITMGRLKRSLQRAKGTLVVEYQRILSLVIVVVIVMIVYGNDLQIVVNEAFQNDSLSHILLVPFLAGFLFYLKRDLVEASLALENGKNRARKLVDEAVGGAFCLAAFIVYWYGSYTFYPLEYHILSLPIMLVGFVLILLNAKALKFLVLPILFSLFLVPIPTELTYALGGVVGNFNTQASYALLKFFGLSVILQVTNGPPMLALETSGSPIVFTVDMACSGIYTITVFGMFTVFLAIVISGSLPKKTVMFAVGFVLLEALNVLRISTTVLLAHWFGQEVAMLLFHSVGGLAFIFLGMLVTLYFGKKILHIEIFPGMPDQSGCSKCDSEVKSLKSFCSGCGRHLKMLGGKVSREVWLKLVVLLLGCSIAVGSVTAPTFAIAQNSIGVASGWENATEVLPSVITYQNTSWVPRFNYRDTYYEKLARQDASLMYTYNMTPTLFVDIGVADSISNLHNWEVCFISWQVAQGQYPLVTVLESKEVELLPGVRLVARYLVFEKRPENYTQSTLYWYERATFRMGATVEQKYVRISLVMYTRNPEDYQKFRDELFFAGESIASYWQPLKEQSLVSLGVPTMQISLFSAVAFAGIVEVGDYSNQSRKKYVNRRIFDKIASAEEKVRLKTILEQLRKRKFMCTSEILEVLETRLGKPVDAQKSLEILKSMEEYGFLRRDVISFGTRSVLVWKT